MWAHLIIREYSDMDALLNQLFESIDEAVGEIWIEKFIYQKN